jgi:RNA polymerase primary sigma factor
MATATLRKRSTQRRAKPNSTKTGTASPSHDPELRRRARQLLDREIDFIGNREFSQRCAKRRILGLASEEPAREVKTRMPKDLPAHLARLCESSLLSAAEERDLFRRMNYLKFQANVLRSRLNPEHPDAEAINKLDRCLKEAGGVRDLIIKANMRLVISIVKKFVTPKHPFDDLLSDGIVSVMQAVDKFDYDRGFRFSTYAYRAIARNAYRTITDRHKEDTRFDAAMSDDLCNVPDEDRVSALDEKEWSSMRTLMLQLMDRLDRRERFILRGRFALGAHRKVRTFQCLADKLGISKERVRQLEQRAIAKLKMMVEQSQPDCGAEMLLQGT